MHIYIYIHILFTSTICTCVIILCIYIMFEFCSAKMFVLINTIDLNNMFAMMFAEVFVKMRSSKDIYASLSSAAPCGDVKMFELEA